MMFILLIFPGYTFSAYKICLNVFFSDFLDQQLYLCGILKEHFFIFLFSKDILIDVKTLKFHITLIIYINTLNDNERDFKIIS